MVRKFPTELTWKRFLSFYYKHIKRREHNYAFKVKEDDDDDDDDNYVSVVVITCPIPSILSEEP